LSNPNFLSIQKIRFTHLQQCDENHGVYLAKTGHQSEKAGGIMTRHAQ